MWKWSLVPILMLTAGRALAAAPETGSFRELLDLDRLILPYESVAHQASSFDRSGGNDDGAIEKNMLVRKEGDGLVVFDQQGPGCIYRVWSAAPGEGWIRFYFDGAAEPAIDFDKFGQMFDGSHPPFVKPFSQGALGGCCSYVPIPFKKSCKVVMGGKPGAAYLQITWRKFASDQGVRTFTMELPPDEKQNMERVAAAWTALGSPPVPFKPDAKTITQPFSAATPTIPLASVDGTGIVRSFKLKLTAADPLYLRKVALRIFTDGQAQPDVWSPVGDFFMTGFGTIDTTGLLMGAKAGGMYCYFPMPFAKGLRIELVNEANLKVTGELELVYEPLPSLPPDALRFHAWWHRENPPTPGQSLTILDAKGRGHWCGLSLYMESSGGLGFMEGDEQLSIDGRDKTDFHGTGTEDYFNCGWYIRVTGCLPLHGCTICTEAPSYVHAFRVHISDVVPFTKEAHIRMEHGPINDREADYMGVAYWYAAPSATHSFPPVAIDQRLPRPMMVMKATEAETALVGADGGEVTKVNEVPLPFRLSAGEGVLFKPTADHATVYFRGGAPDETGYDVLAWFVAGPEGGKAQLLVDGQTAGDEFDTYAPQPELRKLTVGGAANLTAGEHTIAFAVRGQNPASKGRNLFVDCLRLAHRGILEAEDLVVLDKSPCRLLPQTLHNEKYHWSDDMQLWFLPGDPNTSFTLEMPVAKTGKYRVSVFMGKAGDYGIVQFKIDGQRVGEPFDGYMPGLVRSPEVDLGQMELTEGKHKFTVEVTGKNASSHGFLAGLDCIILKPSD